jgi:hypothetical protein
MPTIKQEISGLNWVNLILKLKSIFNKIESQKITESATISAMGNTTDLTAISAVYADLSEARVSVNTLRTDSEARLVAIEAKVDIIILALKTSGVVAD